MYYCCRIDYVKIDCVKLNGFVCNTNTSLQCRDIDDMGIVRSLVISFVSKGFPYKDQIEELFIVVVYYMYVLCYMYSQRVTLATFSD